MKKGVGQGDRRGAALRLGAAGFVATAVTFGPARSGYGLFLPHFREEFGLSTAVLALIASGLYAGYLLALSAVGLLAARVGPRSLVVAGLVAAALGMALVGLAGDAWTLAAGVVLAGTSAGWSWAPYNDAADLVVAPAGRGRVLSAVSTGTTLGILLTGLTALLVGADWRVAWLAFAAAAVAAMVPNALVLPGGASHPRSGAVRDAASRGRWGWLARPEAVPLYVVAASFGVVTAFYFSFAVDLVVASGGLARASAGPVLYAVMGASGLTGLLTGDAILRYGLRPVLVAALGLLSAAALLLGFAPSSWGAIGTSAALYGSGIMVMSALLSVWSSDVFPESPSTGFSATLVVFGAGLTAGPVALGALASAAGFRTAFLTAAAIALLTALANPRREPSAGP